MSYSDKKEIKLAHTSFPQPANDRKKVWRYMSLAKFLNLVLTKSLYMSRVDLLGDLHEGSFTKHLSSIGTDNVYKDVNGIAIPVKERRQKLRKTMFVNCWRIDNYESEAMWKLYCPNNEGLAIQTTYNKLVDSVIDKDSVYIGLIKYLDYEKSNFDDGNVLNPIMHKRKAFEHEKEVRIVKIQTDPWNDNLLEIIEEGMNLQWDISCIEKVYINPYAEQWYFETVKALFEKLGLGVKLEWSHIKSEPYY